MSESCRRLSSVSIHGIGELPQGTISKRVVDSHTALRGIRESMRDDLNYLMTNVELVRVNLVKRCMLNLAWGCTKVADPACKVAFYEDHPQSSDTDRV
ncbi:hypothetical protein N7535_003503 [Penicillium sp. DV-2018c]|nr:hypothetical protein N7461_000794 [Penicillium sp. DV-2018c]KAJ5576577.1 hypothetical protein N7535_003503 [Penicillium sp. DV-2018c]